MELVSYFKKKYPHIEEDDLDILEDSAKEILIHLLFKSSYVVDDSRKEYAYEYYKYWIMRCMQEMIERLGMTSVISYKENGISITFGREQISQSLIDEIVPIAFVR